MRHLLDDDSDERAVDKVCFSDLGVARRCDCVEVCVCFEVSCLLV